MIERMDALVIGLGLFVFGLTLGSFACAMVWRLRAHQLKEDKQAGEQVDGKEYRRLKPLLGVSSKDDRSRCLSCGHQLAWYDLLPLASWLSLGGKCRYCKSRIGWLEPVAELGLGLVFAASFIWWPVALDGVLAWLQYGLWLAACVGMTTLLIYDAKWFLLPNRVMFIVIGIGALSAGLGIATSDNVGVGLVNLFWAVMILSGFYWLLHKISDGRWVGFGDVKLGLALALLLGQWPLALFTLFAANVIGCLIVLPGMLTRRLGRQAHVPFGPMLIAGWLLASLFGQVIIDWYMAAILPGL